VSKNFLENWGGLGGRRREKRGVGRTYGTHVVEVDFEGVVGDVRAALEDVAGELGCDCHGCD